MAKIVRVEFFMVNLQPKVRRADAIQSFVSQAPPPSCAPRTVMGPRGWVIAIPSARAALR